MRKEEASRKRREQKARYLARMRSNPDDKLHGTPGGYTIGCRCERCMKARRAYEKVRPERRVRRLAVLKSQENAAMLEKLEESAKPCEVEIYGIGKVAI